MGQARNHLLFPQPRLLLDRLLQDHKVGRGPACAHGTETVKSLSPTFPANCYWSHSPGRALNWIPHALDVGRRTFLGKEPNYRPAKRIATLWGRIVVGGLQNDCSAEPPSRNNRYLVARIVCQLARSPSAGFESLIKLPKLLVFRFANTHSRLLAKCIRCAICALCSGQERSEHKSLQRLGLHQIPSGQSIVRLMAIHLKPWAGTVFVSPTWCG